MSYELKFLEKIYWLILHKILNIFFIYTIKFNEFDIKKLPERNDIKNIVVMHEHLHTF